MTPFGHLGVNIVTISVSRLDLAAAPGGYSPVLAFCTLLVGGLVIHDVKLLSSKSKKRYLVAMPNKRMTARCRNCNEKNHLKANYCNGCGDPFGPVPVEVDETGREQVYIDLVHPADQEARAAVHAAVVEAYERAVASAGCGR